MRAIAFIVAGLMTTSLYAGTMKIMRDDGIVVNITYSDKYSFKDFTNKDLTAEKGMSNIIIVGSCFYNDKGPDTKVFPDTMDKVTFYRCNLDNVVIPAGNAVDGSCTVKRIKDMNDSRDWQVDATNQPVKVINEASWILDGYTVDKADIPTTKKPLSELPKTGAEAPK